MKDKYLIDKGWQQMSDLLDREMPQNSNKNRRIVLLLVFLLVGIISGFYMLNNSENHKSREHTQPLKEKELSSKNSFASLNHAPYIKTNTAASPSQDVDKISGEINTNIVFADKLKNKHNNSFAIKNKYYKREYNKGKTLKHLLQNSKEESENNYLNSEENELHKNSRKLISVHKLDIGAIKYLKRDLVLLFPRKTDLDLGFINKPHWNGTLLADISVVSEDIKSVGGVSSSIEYDVDLSKGIGIGVGADFSFFRKNGMSNSFLTNVLDVSAYDGSLESKKIRKGTDLTSRYYEEFNFATRNPYTLGGFIDKLYYVGLPVSVYYKTKKYKLAIGLKPSYLVYGTNFIANKNYIGGQNYVIYSRKAFLKSNVFNKIDYSSFITFSYSVGKSFSLLGRFNYSFTHIISSPESQLSKDSDRVYFPEISLEYKNRYDNNIYFGIGLSYEF